MTEEGVANWGNALQGMGAWWAGKGPEWENAQTLAAEEKRRLREDGQKDLLARNRMARMRLERGDLAGAAQAYQEIVDGAPAYGLSSTAASGVLDLLNQGKTEEALTTIATLDDEATMTGVFEGAENKMSTGKTLEFANGAIHHVFKDGDVFIDTPDGKRIGREEPGYREAVVEATQSGVINEYQMAGAREQGQAEVELNTAGPIAAAAAGAGEQARQDVLAETAPDLARNTELAKSAAAQSDKALDRVAKIREGFSRYDKVVDAIDAGADTGVIMSRLPSFKQSTLLLEASARQMGLDVVTAVTFGALSEKELAMAQATALPQGMDEKGLRQWVIDKRDAEAALANYLEDYAIYLAQPGASAAGWAEKQKASRKPGDDVADPLGLRSRR